MELHYPSIVKPESNNVIWVYYDNYEFNDYIPGYIFILIEKFNQLNYSIQFEEGEFKSQNIDTTITWQYDFGFFGYTRIENKLPIEESIKLIQGIGINEDILQKAYQKLDW
jgi:hypothetical protein